MAKDGTGRNGVDGLAGGKPCVALTAEETEEFRQIFAVYDLDGDGRVLRNEAFNILKAIGLSLPTVDAQTSKNLHGSRKNGAFNNGLSATAAAAATTTATAAAVSKGLTSDTVDFDEFLRLVDEARRIHDPEADIREAFRLFDRDGDGFLTSRELKLAMMNLGEKMTDEEVEEMIKMADCDKNGKIDVDEFVKMLTEKI